MQWLVFERVILLASQPIVQMWTGICAVLTADVVTTGEVYY